MFFPLTPVHPNHKITTDIKLNNELVFNVLDGSKSTLKQKQRGWGALLCCFTLSSRYIQSDDTL
jgi:hypothetical protein